MTFRERFLCGLEPYSIQEPLKMQDFPALFRAADRHSLTQQTIYFRLLFVELLLLVVVTAISTLNVQWPSMAIIQAIALFGVMACAIYLFAAQPDRHWYSARAIAESVKTVTWRYVMKAEPFDIEDSQAQSRFGTILGEIIDQNKDVAKYFSSELNGSQITPVMDELRSSSFDGRKSAYINGRVGEQQSWYARKNRANDCLAKRSFYLLISCTVLAGVFAISRVRFIGASIWPTDVFVTLSSTVLAWAQAKRYSELAASYSLAAHEISIVMLKSETVTSEKALSDFVADAENAFSREHTQWVARKRV